jgi:hypothetical protein
LKWDSEIRILLFNLYLSLFGRWIIRRTCVEAGEFAYRTYHLAIAVGAEVEARVGVASTFLTNGILVIITDSAKTFAHKTTGNSYATLAIFGLSLKGFYIWSPISTRCSPVSSRNGL